MALIRCIDSNENVRPRFKIRLQQKVNVVLEYRATQQLLADAKEKEALKKVEEQEKNKK